MQNPIIELKIVKPIKDYFFLISKKNLSTLPLKKLLIIKVIHIHCRKHRKIQEREELIILRDNDYQFWSFLSIFSYMYNINWDQNWSKFFHLALWNCEHSLMQSDRLKRLFPCDQLVIEKLSYWIKEYSYFIYLFLF